MYRIAVETHEDMDEYENDVPMNEVFVAPGNNLSTQRVKILLSKLEPGKWPMIQSKNSISH